VCVFAVGAAGLIQTAIEFGKSLHHIAPSILFEAYLSRSQDVVGGLSAQIEVDLKNSGAFRATVPK
jgi:hypothetical protein